MAVAVVLLSSVPAGASEPVVSCSGCVVEDEYGHELWGRDEDLPLPNASTTKMVTAMVVLQCTPLEQKITVSPNAAAVPGGLWELQAGETYSVRELLYGLLMASSNDAAVALAEGSCVPGDDFIVAMNKTAAALGARDTHFVTPHGLDAPGHHSTARDLATLGLALLDEPILRRIVGTTSHTISDGTVLTNSNPLLESYPGAIGIKTGSTLEAGEVLVAAARRDGSTVVSVALGSADAASDAATMLDYGFEVVTTGPGARVVAAAGTVVDAARKLLARGVLG